MQIKLFWRLIRQKLEPYTSDPTEDDSDWPKEPWYNSRKCLDPEPIWDCRDPQNHQVRELDVEKLTKHLPRTLITTDLGTKHHTFRLQFNHFLAEAPAIAVFSEAQWAPVPTTWRNISTWRRPRYNIRFCWPRGLLQRRSTCTIKVLVGSRWQYEIPSKVAKRWSAEGRLLLVDWADLYESYFAQERKEKNKKRAKEIVKRYRQLERTTLASETERLWTSYDDLDIYPATAADVALACGYEGEKFEDMLDPTKKRLSARLRKLVKKISERVEPWLTFDPEKRI